MTVIDVHPVRSRALALTAVALVASLALALVAGRAPAEAASPGLYFPAPAGTRWQVASGYNTATHSLTDGGDPYALDIVRVDAPTADTPVFAPIDGTISFVESSGSRCIGMREAAGDTVMMCHLYPDASLRRGQPVTRGTQLATVAKAGDSANNGLAHIHFAVSEPSGGGGWGLGLTVPFIGQYAIEASRCPRSPRRTPTPASSSVRRTRWRTRRRCTPATTSRCGPAPPSH